MMGGWSSAYSVGAGSVVADGLEVDGGGLAAAAPEVQSLLADAVGADEVREAMGDVAQTQFRRDALERVLTDARQPEEWRVGEALAEHHLVSDHGCEFPWPSGRDLGNPGTSGGGVDLVGFHTEGDEVRLALGEVKTSRQQAWPPSVMTGRHGLHKQVEGLRDGDDRKTWAIRYLAVHAVDKPWLSQFKGAWARYADDPTDVRLFGTLVHLAPPKSEDLTARARGLASGCPAKTRIKLHAIYLPDDGLDKLAGRSVTVETA